MSSCRLSFPVQSANSSGIVKTSFASPGYLKQECRTPIAWESLDPEYGGPTCLQLQHTGMAYHNYCTYLSVWESFSRSGNGTKDLASRPKRFALLNDNMTVAAPWIEHEFYNMTELYDEYKRVIVDVYMAMPHVGVADAAMDPTNQILQPKNLDGKGLYHVHASVPSPVVNVLCAMLSESDVRPLIDKHSHALPDPYLGKISLLHKLFKWGESYGDYIWPPTFTKLPPEHNTIINETRNMTYGREATYLLGNAAMTTDTREYHFPLCQIVVSVTPRCSTWYNASSFGTAMEAVCEDPEDQLAYIKSVPDTINGNASPSRDRSNVGGE